MDTYAVARASQYLDGYSVGIEARGNGKIAVAMTVDADFSEELAKKVLTEHDITVIVRFYQGDGEAKAWGCDLTYDYVKINGDYRT